MLLFEEGFIINYGHAEKEKLRQVVMKDTYLQNFGKKVGRLLFTSIVIHR